MAVHVAHRTVVDRLRVRTVEQPVGPDDLPEHGRGPSPERDVLRDELLAQLAQALEGLSQRERDGLALRFAARLSMAHVADVLDTTVGAAKMMIHRAIRRLEQDVTAPAPVDQQPADLEAVIDDVLVRGHETIDDSELHGMLVHLAAVHDSTTPDGLSDHVAHCVQCEAEAELVEDDGGRGTDDDPGGGPSGHGNGHDVGAIGRGVARSRLAGIGAGLLAFSGVCLACTVPALQTLLWALGVGAAGYYLHLGGIAAVPFVLYLIWRGVRRHGIDRGYRWARIGAIVIGVHAVVHLVMETVPADAVATWVRITAEVSFVASDWVGTALLVAGAVLNLIDMHRWRRTQAAGLRALVAA